jgi:hypothetical protein
VCRALSAECSLQLVHPDPHSFVGLVVPLRGILYFKKLLTGPGVLCHADLKERTQSVEREVTRMGG